MSEQELGRKLKDRIAERLNWAETDLAKANTRRLATWEDRITASGSAAQCLIAMKMGTDELHICFPHGAKLHDLETLLKAALAEVQSKLSVPVV